MHLGRHKISLAVVCHLFSFVNFNSFVGLGGGGRVFSYGGGKNSVTNRGRTKKKTTKWLKKMLSGKILYISNFLLQLLLNLNFNYKHTHTHTYTHIYIHTRTHTPTPIHQIFKSFPITTCATKFLICLNRHVHGLKDLQPCTYSTA